MKFDGDYMAYNNKKKTKKPGLYSIQVWQPWNWVNKDLVQISRHSCKINEVGYQLVM